VRHYTPRVESIRRHRTSAKVKSFRNAIPLRLVERFRSEELLPLGSRIRVRLALERAAPAELESCLKHALNKAGATKLMTPELIATLCDHAQGNVRALMNMASELLSIAAQREARHIDETLFLETYAQPTESKAAGGRRR